MDWRQTRARSPRRLPTMTHRLIAPGVHLLTRPDGSMQVGIDPRRSVVVPAAFATAVSDDVSQGVCPDVLAGFLTPPADDVSGLDPLLRLNAGRHPVPGATRTQVRIHGAGRLGTTIALLLAGCGLPHIRVVDNRSVGLEDVTPWGASRVDIGARRDLTCATIMERVRRDALHKQLHPAHVERLLVVYAPDQRADWPWADVTECDEWLAADTPHIVAITSGDTGAVSHVIEPGVTPCARCAHEARADVDPAWPVLDAQIRNKQSVDTAPLPVVLVTALLTVTRVVGWLADGAHGMVGLTYTAWPGAAVSPDPWGAHPACGCTWPD